MKRSVSGMPYASRGRNRKRRRRRITIESLYTMLIHKN
jgi:hypothetical protein